LTDAKLQTLLCTSRITEAETFYRDVLGLTLTDRSDGALVFDVGGGTLRVAPSKCPPPSLRSTTAGAETGRSTHPARQMMSTS
jgi:catechol 2,3-dioxygenase-like lactoylglutathione lyase family enzyme